MNESQHYFIIITLYSGDLLALGIIKMIKEIGVARRKWYEICRDALSESRYRGCCSSFKITDTGADGSKKWRLTV